MGLLRVLTLLCCLLPFLTPAQADCLTAEDPIATDRPSVPDTSPAVPTGSIQLENGFGASRAQGSTAVDWPETRMRVGLAACSEFLVDLPDYSQVLGHGPVGVTDFSPAVKHQFTDLPDGLTLWGTVGMAIPTGNKALSGRGPAPFARLPVTYDLGNGFSINGMYQVMIHPRDSDTAPVSQSSLFLDWTVNEHTDLYAEFFNVAQHDMAPQNAIDFAAAYRFAELRQIDFKVGMGINRAAPDWYFTIGYSLRFDHVF